RRGGAEARRRARGGAAPRRRPLRPLAGARGHPGMISFTNVCKQYGEQILFVDASFTGEEQADDGVVERPPRATIGYFRQDVGERSGRSVLAETIAGAGEVAELGEELARLEHRMAAGGVDLDPVVERYGEVQARYQELGGYQIEARAQAILAGLGLHPE